jgi:hypothetical protein
MTALRTASHKACLVGTAVGLLTVALAQAQAPTPTTNSAPHATVARTHAAKASRPSQPLDLHAPALNRIYTRKQLSYILAYDPDDLSDTEVSVKGSRAAVNVPVTPGNQLLALPWALLHPTQAWRVFTPIEQP